MSAPIRFPELAAERAYARHVNRQKAYGRWRPWTDAQPARDHVRALMAAGMGARQVAAAAGVSRGSLNFLLWGDAGRGLPPAQKLRPHISEALLGVQPSPENLTPKARVTAHGTRRRLQALACLGWTARAVAPIAGCEAANLARITHGPQPTVTVTTHRKVAAAYERLWRARPPEDAKGLRSAAGIARARAKRQGWAMPMCWGTDIDNPKARPTGMRKDQEAA